VHASRNDLLSYKSSCIALLALMLAAMTVMAAVPTKLSLWIGAMVFGAGMSGCFAAALAQMQVSRYCATLVAVFTRARCAAAELPWSQHALQAYISCSPCAHSAVIHAAKRALCPTAPTHSPCRTAAPTIALPARCHCSAPPPPSLLHVNRTARAA
jgi:hypothetical protein